MEEITKIVFDDKRYPKILKTIKNPPAALYIKGKLLSDKNCFGIVGTRMCSPYGKDMTLEIAGDLCEQGLTIVSGLAPGIDTYVHTAVVEKNKRTIAVLGTGLDEKSIYPQTNLSLAKRILEKGGVLISEYPPGTPGSKITFPYRNRIISGLSQGILVIEAKQKSGSLITARWARKQQRKVFALPGPVYSSNSKGCHYLIKRGAKLVESANDILKELKLPGKIKTLDFKGENEEENLILNVLKDEPIYIDKIIEKTNLPAQKVIAHLANLEIREKIKNLGENIYAIGNR